MFIISPYTYAIALLNNWYFLTFVKIPMNIINLFNISLIALMWWKYQLDERKEILSAEPKKVVSNLVKIFVNKQNEHLYCLSLSSFVEMEIVC